MGKNNYGDMKCPDCGKPVVVKANANETLSYTCTECDSSAYARKGAGNYTSWLGRITKRAAPAPKDDAPPKPPAKGEEKPSLLDDII